MVDIILVTYNQHAHLRQCLWNLRENAGAPCRIIVVSDGCTDGTINWLGSEEAKGLYDVLIKKPNGGVSSAFNCGIVLSEADLICTLAGDYVMPKDWLKNEMLVLSSGAYHFVAFGSRRLHVNLQVDSPCYGYESFQSDKPVRLSPKAFPEDKLITYNGVQVLPEKPEGNIALLCRREVYETAGLYTEFGTYGHNDAEFMFRAKRSARGGWNRFAIVAQRAQHLMQHDPALLRYKSITAAANKRKIEACDYHTPTYEECVDKYSKYGRAEAAG